jgi:hypothetical protein
MLYLLLQWSRTHLPDRWCQQRCDANTEHHHQKREGWGMSVLQKHVFFHISMWCYFYWRVKTNFVDINLLWQILVPVPQYPLYSASISLYGGSLVPYYLEEEANWSLDFVNIRQTVAEARSKGITVSVLLVIIVLIKISLLLLHDFCNFCTCHYELAFAHL